MKLIMSKEIRDIHTRMKKYLDETNELECQKETEDTIRFLKFLLRSDREPAKKFLREMIIQGQRNYFLVNGAKFNIPAVGLVSKSLKAVMFLSFNITDSKFIDLFKSDDVLQLRHIHSFEKGQGKELMNDFLQIHKTLNTPGSLFTETAKLVSYYEEFGFINSGKRGDNSEYLMKLPVLSPSIEVPKFDIVLNDYSSKKIKTGILTRIRDLIMPRK